DVAVAVGPGLVKREGPRTRRRGREGSAAQVVRVPMVRRRQPRGAAEAAVAEAVGVYRRTTRPAVERLRVAEVHRAEGGEAPGGVAVVLVEQPTGEVQRPALGDAAVAQRVAVVAALAVGEGTGLGEVEVVGLRPGAGGDAVTLRPAEEDPAVAGDRAQ